MNSPADRRAPSGIVNVSRVRLSHIEWLEARLSSRDWEIIEALNRVRVASGEQLERLVFDNLPSLRSRVVSRNRVLSRLAAWRVLVPLERRIGGAGRGSTRAVFALDSAGCRLMATRHQVTAEPSRVRRPGTPSMRTLKHLLAVSELYVRLVELGRLHGFHVAAYDAEPACWWPDGLNGYIKPDAYAALAYGDVVDHWWIEHDEATESLPVVRSKLLTYLDFVQRGQLGPSQLVPRVLISCITEQRQEAVRHLVRKLPEPATALMVAVHAARAAPAMAEVLLE